MNHYPDAAFFHPTYGMCYPVWDEAYMVGDQNPRWGGLINTHAVVPVRSRDAGSWSMELRYPVCYRVTSSIYGLTNINSVERLPGPPQLVVVSHTNELDPSDRKDFVTLYKRIP